MNDETPRLPAPAGKSARRRGRAGAAGPSNERTEIDRADHAAAAAMRRRLAGGPAIEIEPDPAIARLLVPGERLFSFRKGAVLDRRETQQAGMTGLVGDLYLTSARIAFLGSVVVSWFLADLEEVILFEGGLLLLMGDGLGVRLGVDRPQLLRVEIAAARRETAG